MSANSSPSAVPSANGSGEYLTATAPDQALIVWSPTTSEPRDRFGEILSSTTRFKVMLADEVLNGGDAGAQAERIAAVASRQRPRFIVFLLDGDRLQEFGLVLARLRQSHRAMPVLGVVVGRAAPDELIHLLELGVDDFITTPLRAEELVPRVARWLGRSAASDPSFDEIKARLGMRRFVGQSPAMLAVLQRLVPLANCDATLLILGETGTGKEVCARSVHYLSPRADGPFVPVNCGAIPVDLIENELFGHESGAFTGASSRQTGLLVDADGGTLFLDEIDTLPISAQVKLLRFLQEKEFRPLGSGKPRRVDARLIAASNANLEEAMWAGRFRRDLFYRVGVMSIELPPLRDRPGDLPLLAHHFVERYANEFRRPVRTIAPAALRELRAYAWPGNVRELENVIQRAVLLAQGPTIGVSDLMLTRPARDPADASFRSLKARAVREFERSYLESMLREHRNNISAAARAACKNRRAFWGLLRKHQLLPAVAAGSDI
jgi:two-component system, NtrC family, response regulator GlrR